MAVDARDPELGFQSWLFRPALNPDLEKVKSFQRFVKQMVHITYH